MAAFDLSSFAHVLDELQPTTPRCSANLNGQFQQCTMTNCLNYDDIDAYLCVFHETYMRGAIFRRRFTDFATTALISYDQSTLSVPGQAAQDVQIVHGTRATTVFSGAKLDELTTGLHREIKAGIIHHIEDYILFLGDRPDKHNVLKESDSHFGARYRQQVLVDASNGLAVMVGFTTNLRVRLQYLQECSANQAALATFPQTSRHAARCMQPAFLVELLAGVVHELLVAHQHDIWCPCNSLNGRTHTQVYWFQGLNAVQPFAKLMSSLGPKIQKWVDALKVVEKNIGHLYQRQG
ncbi:hypothetical protein BGZ47_009006 [Haplosporangium gracile]|nr:hypothetical protein BGZ47_009006 [Haplosporangium gracile]